MYTDEITSKFINRYKVFEKLRDSNFSLYESLKQKNPDLYDEFRNTRNVLSHNINGDGTYPILVSQELLNKLNHQIKLMTLTVEKVMSRVGKFTYFSMETPMNRIIDIMDKRNFSHVPIINSNGIMTHVVSLDAIMNVLSTNKGVIGYDNNTTVNNYKKHFEIDNNDNEYYLFMARNELAFKAKRQMQQRINNKKCGMIFVTEHGNKYEKLLGIISSYDLIEI